MRVFQLTENLMEGDAISDNVLALHAALGSLGYEARLFAAHALRSCRGVSVENAAGLERALREDDLLLYQYSIGSPLTGWFLRQRCRKAIVYQNITPSRFFQPWDAALADAARLGREELPAVLAAVDFAIASSLYSERELKALGCTHTEVLPVLVDFARYEAQPDAALLSRLCDGTDNILFVGRKAPNKCIEDVLLAADYYHRSAEKPCRLLLVGDESMTHYCAALRSLMASLRVPVEWLGRVSLPQLIACYRASRLFLCMSEHEGFCVPLLESMHFSLPVLAYDAAAVPETLGGSGVVFAQKDYRQLACVMEQLLHRPELRQTVIDAQRARLEDFRPERVVQRLEEIMKRHSQ